jgi:steroid Delta-isomerase
MQNPSSKDSPALVASRRSWDAVHRKSRAEWLDLFADDARVEDPVGRTPLDPEGNGHQGREAIGAFWDAFIEPNRVQIEMRDSYPAGQEVAHVGSITTRFPEGSPMGSGASLRVDGVFVYKVDDQGKLVSLRGFWDFEQAMQTLTRTS